MNNEVVGVWRTVRGRRIFIAKGEDLASAMEKSGKFKEFGRRGTRQIAEKVKEPHAFMTYPATKAEEQEWYKKTRKKFMKEDEEVKEEYNEKLRQNFKKQDKENYAPKHNIEEVNRVMKNRYKKENEEQNNKLKSMTPKERAREIDKINGKTDYHSMTRQELAELIVDDQIRRGIIKKESREVVIRGRLKGLGASKPMTKSELIEGAKAIEEANKKGE